MCWCNVIRVYNLLTLFFEDFIYLVLERREGESEEEKHQCVVASHKPLTGDLDLKLGMCPDWESNLWPFGSKAHAQSTELQQPGPKPLLYEMLKGLI